MGDNIPNAARNQFVTAVRIGQKELRLMWQGETKQFRVQNHLYHEAWPKIVQFYRQRGQVIKSCANCIHFYQTSRSQANSDGFQGFCLWGRDQSYSLDSQAKVDLFTLCNQFKYSDPEHRVERHVQWLAGSVAS